MVNPVQTGFLVLDVISTTTEGGEMMKAMIFQSNINTTMTDIVITTNGLQTTIATAITEEIEATQNRVENLHRKLLNNVKPNFLLDYEKNFGKIM